MGHGLWVEVHSAKVKVNQAILHYIILMSLFNILNRSVLALPLDLTFSSGPGMVRVREIARVRAREASVGTRLMARDRDRASVMARLGPGQWLILGQQLG